MTVLDRLRKMTDAQLLKWRRARLGAFSLEERRALEIVDAERAKKNQ